MVRPSARRERRDGINGRYKGVRMRKWGKWVAEVRQPNSRDRIWLGSYETQDEAARAYDAAVFCLRGPSATLNFPANPPNIPSAGDLSPSQIQVAASKHARRIPAEAGSEVPQGQMWLPLIPEVKSSVLDSTLFGESSDMYGSSFGGFSTEECYLPIDERGVVLEGVDTTQPGGLFYNSPRVWTF